MGRDSKVAGRPAEVFWEVLEHQPHIDFPSLESEDPWLPLDSLQGSFSKAAPAPFSTLPLLPLLRWIRWRPDHLLREELREKIIWIDKNYNRWKIYCFSRTAPSVLKCGLFHTKGLKHKVLTFKDAWRCFLRNSRRLLHCILFYFNSIAVCQSWCRGIVDFPQLGLFCCESRLTVICNWSRKYESP